MEGLLEILGHLKDGHDLEEAVLKGLSVPFHNLEEDWLRYLKKRMTWLTHVINHLYEILFLMGALILISAFIRRSIQKRAYMHEGEDLDNPG